MIPLPCIDADRTDAARLILKDVDRAAVDATDAVAALRRIVGPMASARPWSSIDEALRADPRDMAAVTLRLAFLDDDVDLMVASWLCALTSSPDAFGVARVTRDVREMRRSGPRPSRVTPGPISHANDG